MVLALLKYPDERIRLISGNIRFFDESLHDIITDMIEEKKTGSSISSPEGEEPL